ncbi:Acyl-coenzyme A:6-aminopenicillanic acid acyl-transferase-like protein [Elsinoe fawcettii]|nr:Acyl-coenzyme A:6-aminopenicillanic acid acyl-transferase-like protein [Elsinoe fawcettii]
MSTGALPRHILSGTPYEIGFAHGSLARSAVHRTIAFYQSLFLKTTKKSWGEVTSLASTFLPFIQTNVPDLLDEMQGVADGAQKSLLDIIAINVRTEINFGLFSDGCTAVGWTDERGSILAQNWDWMEEQKENLVLLDIQGERKVRIQMVTEAGLVGKIGMNEAGVGVCLNAIRRKGMDVEKCPCHLALRVVLESTSREEAVSKLEEWGVASSCHMLIADGKGSVGVEWSSETGRRLEPDAKGRVFHSNHYLHKDLRDSDTSWLKDSGFRVKRIEELCDKLDAPTLDSVQGLFTDEQNYPGAICRKQEGESGSATLFNIVMDLRAKKAKILYGRPVAPEDKAEIAF